MTNTRDTAIARQAYERAFALIRTSVIKWQRDVCQLKRGDKRFTLDTALFATELDKRPSAYVPESLALRLADALGLPVDEELVLDDIVKALSLMRPRFVPHDVLEGPGRNMCRRNIGPDVLLAISLGRHTTRNFVTTRMLDAWKMSFDEVLDAAIEELMRAFGPEDIKPHPADPRVLSITHEREPAASVILGLDRIVEGLDAWPGCLVGKPAEDTLLPVPLDETSTIKDLGAIIEATYTVANEHARPLSAQPCWLYNGAIHAMGLRMTDTKGGRRATVETNHPGVAHLLQFLSGEASCDPPEDPDVE